MVVFTPMQGTPAPVTPYEYLDNRISTISSQMDELMVHFRSLTPVSIPQTGYPSVASPPPASASALRPPLVPTPDVQQPPPHVAASNAELIGDRPVRLSYTPQGPSHHQRQPPSRPLSSSDFRSSAEARHLHSSLRRDELFVSGYYWSPPTPITNAHCIAWLDPNLDGPYAGKHDRIAKLSFKLADNSLAGFMKFYTGL